MDRQKRGLMTQFPFAREREYVCKNIGDYIQSVAAKQFASPIDEYVEQEEMNSYVPTDKRKLRVIMNGWFQWRAENWPPSQWIQPLLVSMHISPLRSEQLLNNDGIDFLKKFGPVGCRDMNTLELLKSKEIPAYFSGCLTLTLGLKYKVNEKEKRGVCFVDPYFDIPLSTTVWDKVKSVLKDIVYWITHFKIIMKLQSNEFFKIYSAKGFLDRRKGVFRKLRKTVNFHRIYGQKFSDEILRNAKYVTHWVDVKMDGSVTNDDLLGYAEELIKLYAHSSMVVTSRIHAGLPCLAVGTPVIFISNEEVICDAGSFNTPGRMKGLLEQFRIYNLSNGTLTTDDPELRGIEKFTGTQTFRNKNEWKEYAGKLKKQCEDFMK